MAQPNAILATDPSPWQQQATKVEQAVNLKTAKTLGLAILSGVLAIADEMIE